MIRKTSETRPLTGTIVNSYNDSQVNAYSCKYIEDVITYSETETNTRKKWIDGKDIYRRVLTGTLPSADGGISGVNLYFDTLVDFKVSATQANGHVVQNATSFKVSANGSNGSVYVSFQSDNLKSRPFILIAEYTKSSQ